MSDPRRSIPSVDRLLASEAFVELLGREPRDLVVQAVQEVQAELRERLAAFPAAGEDIGEAAWYAGRAAQALHRLRRPSLGPAINATGVVLHTNLGRAPLAAVARAAVEEIARGYSNLEYDLDRGTRGSRYTHCTGLLTQLTGAEAALVVNNNAAALVLALNTLADGRDVVISRGELVEIGGSFRVPDIMARSGARMAEIGSTNRTHLDDYREAVGPGTAVILKVHPSNFRVHGFTAEASLTDLAPLAREAGVVLMHDLGSGLLLDSRRLGLPYEPTARDALGEGADVVTMSGDKLLGGPQAGIILGRHETVDAMRKNPLCRALRVDKLTLAALEATLALYLDPERALREVPVLRMLGTPADELGERAERLATRLRGLGLDVETGPGRSAVGGGAFPTADLPTRLVRLAAPGLSADGLEERLRAGSPPIIARIQESRVIIDPRTVAEEEEDRLVDAVREATL